MSMTPKKGLFNLKFGNMHDIMNSSIQENIEKLCKERKITVRDCLPVILPRIEKFLGKRINSEKMIMFLNHYSKYPYGKEALVTLFECKAQATVIELDRMEGGHYVLQVL
jgi:hypothetical protein